MPVVVRSKVPSRASGKILPDGDFGTQIIKASNVKCFGMKRVELIDFALL